MLLNPSQSLPLGIDLVTSTHSWRPAFIKMMISNLRLHHLIHLFLQLSCCPVSWSEFPILLSVRTISKFATPFVEPCPLVLAGSSLATRLVSPALPYILHLSFSLLSMLLMPLDASFPKWHQLEAAIVQTAQDQELLNLKCSYSSAPYCLCDHEQIT